MMKQALNLPTALVMLLGCACAETVPEERGHQIEVNEVPVYEDSKDGAMDTKYPVCLIDGVRDLPFTDLESWTAFMNDFMTDGGESPGYELKMTTNEDERLVALARENGYTAWFNFNTGSVIFDDYGAFTNDADAEYLDVADIQVPELLKMTAGRHVYGNITTLNLKEYGIPMIFQDGKFLLPMQTLSALFLYPMQYAVYYNGEAIFVTPANAMTDPLENMKKQLISSGALTQEIREKFKAYDGPKEGKAEYLFDMISRTPEEKASLMQPCENGADGYYKQAQEGSLPEDTFGIIIDVHRKITRENSPIKNVVLDLSCNTGGSIPAAVYTLCWFLGESRVFVHNTFTGAQSTMFYKADINMDHVQDEQDTLAGRGLNLFCLISPVSFSCGNLVPWAFKENGTVTLLGRTSGGGSCVVAPITTAWGTTLKISGARRIAFVKNGSYYDVDRGVEPDYVIHTYEHYYDRDKLTEYISTASTERSVTGING